MSNELTLRDVADERGVSLGAAIDPDTLRRDPSYWKTASSEFNVLTPENALKMGPLRPSRYAYDFRDADAVVEFGENHDATVRGHTSSGTTRNPTGSRPGSTPRPASSVPARSHHTVVGRYHGRIDAWDVVNEAVADDGSMRKTVWYDALGEVPRGRVPVGP